MTAALAAGAELAESAAGVADVSEQLGLVPEELLEQAEAPALTAAAGVGAEEFSVETGDVPMTAAVGVGALELELAAVTAIVRAAARTNSSSSKNPKSPRRRKNMAGGV